MYNVYLWKNAIQWCVFLFHKVLLTLHILHLHKGWPAKGLGSCWPNPSSILGLWSLFELRIWNGLE